MALNQTGFTGFGPDLQRFFAELAANQNRDWFLANKARHEANVRDPLIRLVASVNLACAAFDLPFRGDAKSLFRINRDVRFSKNKQPYKTNAGATLTRDGTRKTQGFLYIQVGLDDPVVAAGFWNPDPTQLQALRSAIANDPGRWLAVEQALSARGLALSREHTLTRLPRGFDANAVAPVAHAIRFTSFVTARPLSTDELSRPDLVDTIVSFADAAMPLLRFGWNALSTLAPRRT